MSNASCAGRSQTSLSWQTSHRGWSRWALPSHQCLVEKGTFQVQKLSKCPRVKSCGYIVYQTRVFLHSAGIQLGDGTTIIFYTGQQKIRRATLKHWIFSPIIKFLSLDLLKAKKLSHHKTVSNKSIKPSENTRGLFCVKSGFLTAHTVLGDEWCRQGNPLPSPLKMTVLLPLSQFMFSKPSRVMSTRSLARLFQMRQTSLGHTLETRGTGKNGRNGKGKCAGGAAQRKWTQAQGLLTPGCHSRGGEILIFFSFKEQPA